MNTNQIANLFLLALALVAALWVQRRTERPELAPEGPELDEDDQAFAGAGELGPIPALLHREHVNCSGCGAYVVLSELDDHACAPAVRQ